MDSTCLNINQSGSLSRYWFLESEEEDEQEDNIVTLLEEAQDNLLQELRKWVKANKTGEYKYIGILMNTEVLEIEYALKNYIKKYPQILEKESGDNLLVFHGYKKDSSIDVSSKACLYIKALGVSRVEFPAILLFPGSRMNCTEQKYRERTLTINIQNETKYWEGSIDEYFTRFFRCLFDAIDSVSISEKDSILRLKVDFKRRFKKQIGYSLSRQGLGIINISIMPTIIKSLHHQVTFDQRESNIGNVANNVQGNQNNTQNQAPSS
jgi:hypothetical protein